VTRFDDLVHFIERYPDEAVFSGPKPREEIARAEEVLGVPLPPS
jgi:hypothetical protein